MNVNAHSSITQRQAAIMAGVASLVMVVAAIVAEFFARQSLIVPNDAAATAHNILAYPGSFRLGIFGFMVILVCDMVVAWAMYHFLAPVHKHFSQLAAWFRLVYTALLGMGLLGLVNGFRLLTDAGNTAAMEPQALQQQAMVQFQAFDDGWAIALVFFGLHLLLLGYLAFKSGFVPKLLGVLLLMAGIAYLGDNFAKLLMPNYAQYKAIFTACVAIPSVVGELGLAFWLLIKGGKMIKRVSNA